MRRRRVTRRAFLGLCGAAAAGLAAAVGTRFLSDDGSRHALTERVGGTFSGEALRDVGRAYRASAGGEDSEEELVRALQRRSVWRRAATRAEVLASARRESQRDFAAGDLAAVDGWYLSRTEARLCALATF